MKGLDLSESYYRTYGEPMLKEQFPEVYPFLAAGLFGSGSECFGFDDEISQDHDFEPGFCIMLPDESIVDRRTEFLLERAYSKLPKEHMRFERSRTAPVGGPRHGVFRTADYYRRTVGAPDGILTVAQWMTTEEHRFAEAVNGAVFYDGYGEVTSIRERLSHYPEDIRKKKLAGNLLLMAQAGQYNYQRCLDHGEQAAAQLAAVEYVRRTVQTVFLLNQVYQPFYKWSFRAMRNLDKLSLLAETMEYLLTTDNSEENAESKYLLIEDAASDIIEELQNQGLTKAICGDLEKHAYSVNDGIRDSELRNMNILAAV